MMKQLTSNGTTMLTKPISPSEKISSIIEAMGLGQLEFAKRTGISPSYLSMLLQEQRRLTDSVVVSLAKSTEVKEADWKFLREEYEQWKSMHSSKPRTFNAGATAPGGGVLSNQDILRAIKDRSLIVEPFLQENLSLASLDLTLGESQRLKTSSDSSPSGLEDTKTREHLVIKPGETWRMRTAETITMPDNICGHIAACGELTTHGIFVGFGLQIDPRWSGRPFMALAHWGAEEYELSHGQRFVSLELRLLCSPSSIEL